MGLQAKECQHPPAFGRSNARFPPRDLRGSMALSTPGFQTSGLQNSENKFLFFAFCFFFINTYWIIYLFIFNRSLLDYNCFTILCQFLLYNKVNQPYAYTCPHIPSLLSLPPTLPIPSLQVVTKHRADLPVLYGCFPLASYFTFDSVYMSMLLSLHPCFSPRPPCPQVHSLRLRLYSCPATRFISTIFFLDSIYMRWHTIFVFLFLTSLCMTDFCCFKPPSSW